MRIRNKNTVIESYPALSSGTYHGSTILCNGSSGSALSGPVLGHVSIPSFGVESYMVDSIGKATPHAVWHNSYVYDYRTVDNASYVIPSGAPLGKIVYSDMGPNKIRDAIENTITLMRWPNMGLPPPPPRWTVSPPSVNEPVIINDLLEKAKRLKADVLLDIVEGNQIWPSIRDLALTIPAMGANWRDIRKVIKTASSGYLAWKFGVKPLIQDIKALRQSIPKLGREIEDIGNGRIRYSKECLGIAGPVSSAKDVTAVLNGVDIYERVWTYHCSEAPTVRYVLVVESDTSYHTKFFKSLDVAMHRFGSSPASLAWEKIPFSFVLDWFVDLRGCLRGIDDALGFSPYRIVSFTKSVAYRLETSQRWVFRTPCAGGSTLMDFHGGTCEYRHYERSMVSAGANAPVWKPRFGKNQAGITAALIGQKLRF